MENTFSITSNELTNVIQKIIIEKFHEANKKGYLKINDINKMFENLGLQDIDIDSNESNDTKVFKNENSNKDKESKKSDLNEETKKTDLNEETKKSDLKNESNKPDLDYEEGIKTIKYSKTPNKPTVNLPFCNIIVDNWCYGIRVNHSLYTQCTNKKYKNFYCKTCYKQSNKNKNKLPNAGDIRNRKYNENYTAPNKKTQKKYSSIVKKQKIDIKFAIKEASKLNWTIPDNELKGIKRIKVSPIVSDSSDEDVEVIDSKIKIAAAEFENEESKSDKFININNFKTINIKGNEYYIDKDGKSNFNDKNKNIVKNLVIDKDTGIPVGFYKNGKLLPLNI